MRSGLRNKRLKNTSLLLDRLDWLPYQHAIAVGSEGELASGVDVLLMAVVACVSIQHSLMLPRSARSPFDERVLLDHGHQAAMIAGIRRSRDLGQGRTIPVSHDCVLCPYFPAIDWAGATVRSASKGPDMRGIDDDYVQIQGLCPVELRPNAGMQLPPDPQLFPMS